MTMTSKLTLETCDLGLSRWRSMNAEEREVLIYPGIGTGGHEQSPNHFYRLRVFKMSSR